MSMYSLAKIQFGELEKSFEVWLVCARHFKKAGNHRDIFIRNVCLMGILSRYFFLFYQVIALLYCTWCPIKKMYASDTFLKGDHGVIYGKRMPPSSKFRGPSLFLWAVSEPAASLWCCDNKAHSCKVWTMKEWGCIHSFIWKRCSWRVAKLLECLLACGLPCSPFCCSFVRANNIPVCIRILDT